MDSVNIVMLHTILSKSKEKTVLIVGATYS